MKKIIIAGGTGFLGTCLTKFYLAKNYEIHILTRKKYPDQSHLHYHLWDGKTLDAWSSILEDSEALINLTGKSVDCRYSEKNKKLIYDSRLDSTQILGEAVQNCKNPPKTWINTASATIYRHSLDKPMDEETGEIGTGFSVDVCNKWEKVFTDQQAPKTRKIILRTSIVLGRSGGAFFPLKTLVRLGFGGKQGSGEQFFSWIHERDFVKIVDFIIQNDTAKGIYNVAAPNPIRNKELMSLLRRNLNVLFGLPMPAWLLEIGAFLINTETELVLKSRYVIPQKLVEDNYVFEFPKIDQAIDDLLKKV